jgi:sugar/nucleoside kinase (ribokinase family)
MYHLTRLEPIDYLVIGHLTCDITPQGLRLGGTAAYSSLTARALGLRVGIVTSRGDEVPTSSLLSIPIVNMSVERSTTFENIYTHQGRIQIIHHVAPNLDLNIVPDPWRSAPIVHLGPVAQEVEPSLVRYFPDSFIGLTPQGWLRAWDQVGRVHQTEWPEASFVLNQASAAVISLEDVDGDESRVEEMAAACRIFVVTENTRGARLYWNGDVRRFPAPETPEIDATGAGDIFAAAFFFRLYTTRDPWEAARFATQLASTSITRTGLDGIPTPEEINTCMIEVY